VSSTSIPIVVIVEYWCGFNNRTPYFIREWTWWGTPIILNPNIGLRRWPGTTGPLALGLPPLSRDTTGLPMGSRMRRGGPGPGYVGNPLGGGSAFPSEDTPQFFRQRCLPFWLVHMTSQLMEHQTNTWVFALTVWRPWKLSALSQRPHSFANSRRRWTRSLPGMLWDSIGSRGMQGWEAMKRPTDSRGMALPLGL
jgi:hypothetical protein